MSKTLMASLVVAAGLCAPPLAGTDAFAQEAPPPAPSAVEAPASEGRDYDPWEPMNRRLFAAHEAIDQSLLAPAARGYRLVTPTPVRSGVSNFLRNLRGPQIFANDVLQGEFRRAGVTAARFGVNTTLGFFGLFDPATGMGLERHTEDFGQTLAVWGVPEGPYVFVPVFGPTNVRDGVGAVVNLALDPFNWVEFDGDEYFMASRTVVGALSTRESILDAVDNIRATSIDPYVTFRSTYGILRESAIRNGPIDVQELPEFEEVPLVALEIPLGSSAESPPVDSSVGVQLDSGLLPVLDLDMGGR
jgi:phospholipid-binding lipoprotein MlaA